MYVKVLNRSISIVVVANIDKKICSPFWLHKNNLISDNEMKFITDDSVSISDSYVTFKTSTFDFLCDPVRMQIQTPDITLSSRIISLVRDILRCSQPRVNAIGVNAMMQISFSNGVDFLKFCHHCAPMNGLSPLSANAIFLDLTLLDWSNEPKQGDMQTFYNLKRILTDSNNAPMAQISVNHHQPVNAHIDVINYILERGENLHMGFFDKCDAFIKGIV